MAGLVVIDGTRKKNFSLAQAISRALKSDPVSADFITVPDATTIGDTLDAIPGHKIDYSIIHVDQDFSQLGKDLPNVPTIALVGKGQDTSGISATYTFTVPFKTDQVLKAVKNIINSDFATIDLSYAGFRVRYVKNELAELSYRGLSDAVVSSKMLGFERELIACLVARAAIHTRHLGPDRSLAETFADQTKHYGLKASRSVVANFGPRLNSIVDHLTGGKIVISPVIERGSNEAKDFVLKVKKPEPARHFPKQKHA